MIKLSVLIPTYNYKCYTLVCDLHEQLEASGIEYEILVSDDGSIDGESIDYNRSIDRLSNCRYIIRDENVGRAHNLNFLISESVGEWKLIMDSDASVTHADYISKYIGYMDAGYDVLDGDLENPRTLPYEYSTLRFRYEKNAEKWRTASERNKNAYHRFCTFNVMFRASVLDAVPFDDRCTEYGYEDTLMGIELQRRSFKLLHIDNPLLHEGFESNAVYLSKVETSLRTLHKIKDSLEGETRMTMLYGRLESLRVIWLVKLLYKLSRPLLRRNLLGDTPGIWVLSFYKLGYYASLN